MGTEDPRPGDVVDHQAPQAPVGLGPAFLDGRPGAQEAGQEAGPTGRLMGQVVSAESGAPLPGAQVQVEGTPRGTLAGIEGRFQLDGLPVGELTLRVSMLGYAPLLVPARIEPGATARVDALLVGQAIAVAGVVVTAEQARGPRLADPPVLAVEILSDSSQERDLVIKRREYAEAGLA